MLWPRWSGVRLYRFPSECAHPLASMAPPHGRVALMAALAAAALLLTLDAAVAGARLRSPPGTLKDGVSEKILDLGTLPLKMTQAERLNTLKVLQAFAAAMPSLGWSGDNFCSWSYVTCFDANVRIIVTESRVTGTLPEMPDDVDYSMVKLDQIHMFGQHSGITGTLPSSWVKLRRVRTLNLASRGISGTLPPAWSSMEAIEQIIISSKRITGSLPEAWISLPNLRRLYLQGCSLYGSLPESWARMASLERLDLRKNTFCGCVPLSWLMSRRLRVDVDTRHKFPHCSRAEACVETRTPEPIGSSGSSTSMAELSTVPPPSDHQCSVPNCVSCFPRDSKLCAVCMDGYVLREDGQCMQHPEWEPVPLAMSEAEWWNTLKVLQAFAAAMPSLGWSGGDFCSWSGVRCTDANVGFVVSNSRLSGTLPEMPDDVDYSMVKLSEISIFGQRSGVTGTLPSSWSKLRKLRKVNLAYVGIRGTLPAAWRSMEAMEQIVIANTKITGTLPKAWSALPNLRRIHLQRCGLYGSLPESWARMPSLERLDLRKNKFCGCVPQLWLTSRTLSVEVDSRHQLPHCQRGKGCDETTTPEPIGSRVSSSTLPPLSEHRCAVPNCIACVPRNSKLCGVCMEGYVRTDDWQCMKGPEWEAVPLAMTEAEWRNTLKVLQAFAAAMPSLGWSGGHFCSWSGVRCTDGNVDFVASNSWIGGTLPEMPDDVDYSMVRLNEISIFGQRSGITGTLPSSWGKLRKVRKINLAYTGITGTLPNSWGRLREVQKINLAYTGITGTLPSSWGKLRKVRTINLSYTGISGTLPSAWSSMEAIEQIIISSTQISGTLPESWRVLPNR